MMLTLMMILMMILMTKPYDYDNATDDNNDHKNDSYTAAGAAPAASVPCPLFFRPRSLFLVLLPASGLRSTFRLDLPLDLHYAWISLHIFSRLHSLTVCARRRALEHTAHLSSKGTW